MQTANPSIGQCVGPYVITGLLGQGGMGVVYRAIHIALEQPVALKAIDGAAAADPEIRQRFLREAQLHARLSHPHIVTLHHFFEEPSGFYFALEFVEGETLAALIRRNGTLTTDRCASILSQVLDALAYAHSKGVIHRDIKPSNILLARDGRAKVTDFGIAKAFGKDGMTATGRRPGTLAYVSPEQVLGEPQDARSDLYSLGVTAYEMATGRVPFDGDSDFTVMRAHVETPPTPPRALREDVDPSLEEMILKALAKRPADRFQSAEEWAAALAERGLLFVGPSGTAALVTRMLPGPLEGRRRPWILGAAAAAVIVGVGGLAVFRGLPSGTPVAEVTSPPPASKVPTVRGAPAPSLPDPSQIADQIQRDLRAKGLHRVQASVDPGLRLTLSGSVLDDHEEELALRLARSHPAIKGLDNRIRVATRDR